MSELRRARHATGSVRAALLTGWALLACTLLAGCIPLGRTDGDPTPTRTTPGTSSGPTARSPASSQPDAPGATTQPAPSQSAAGNAQAETFYVSPTGSDNAPGTKDRPWRTWTHALLALGPGDTLYVRGGTYDEQVRADVALGTQEQPIQVLAFPGERPVLSGLLWLKRPSYWTFSNLNVTWSDKNRSNEHMVKITDGVGWRWRGGEIWGARSIANFLVTGDRRGEPSNWALTGSCIHDTYPANGQSEDSNLYIGDMRDAGPGVVEGNLLFTAPNGRNIKLGPGSSSRKKGPDGVTVRYNTLYSAYVPIVIAEGSTDNLVERNIIGGSGSGPLIRAYQLEGEGNMVRDNIGFEASSFFAGDNGTLKVGLGNKLADETLLQDLNGCNGFRPVAAASEYGHLAHE
ncbi:MAG TPA: DUF1565 domain-containing protein [Actinomycetales bacterium]|nr:DUF1565 domain-containing protein [Actinomycetales bacterium]